MQDSVEPRTRKYIKGHGFLSFAIIFCNKYRRKLLDTGLDVLNVLKTALKNVVQKAAEDR